MKVNDIGSQHADYAALIRGRRSLKKFDLKCGAHSRALSIGGGAQTSKYGNSVV